MKIGFTGTRHGMTDPQISSLRNLLFQLGPTEAHHGDCVGADAHFASMARNLVPPGSIVVHPPLESSRRAFAISSDDVILPPKGHLARNLDIVAACDILIGAPAEMAPQARGGTWFTIRKAGVARKPVWVVRPDGSLLGPDRKSYPYVLLPKSPPTPEAP